jgi:hypothetical protein
MLNSIPAVQVSDITDAAGSNVADLNNFPE